MKYSCSQECGDRCFDVFNRRMYSNVTKVEEVNLFDFGVIFMLRPKYNFPKIKYQIEVKL